MDDSDDSPLPESEPPSRAMKRVAHALAQALLAGDSERKAMRQRAEHALGRPWPWLPALVMRVHQRFGDDFSVHQQDRITQHILDTKPFVHAFFGPAPAPRIRAWVPLHPQMAKAEIPGLGPALPALATLADLADWLELSGEALDWLADPAGWRAPPAPAPVEHYRNHWQPKRQGGHRLIEAPKPRLRALQRRILHGILDHVPVHPAAMGCVRGRGVVDNAARHAGQPLLIKLDLRDFFSTIRAARVHALFRHLGYPVAVARYLTGLTTHRSPPHALRALPIGEFDSPEERFKQQRRAHQLSQRHLPQGAPTSPALANLCAYRLDLRLAGAAQECGLRYTRYVDDLSFSGAADPAQGRRILKMIDAIVREEGFEPNWRKAGIHTRATRQQVTGVVVNQHPNLSRDEYDRLKAILTNCARHGPASQNHAGHADFQAHLAGRIGWASTLNPARGEKLREIHARIAWD